MHMYGCMVFIIYVSKVVCIWFISTVAVYNLYAMVQALKKGTVMTELV